ncbi:hypothetical protein IWX46DRAFT_412266 [Phyllosticta citricarpa]|uniref:Uncharacterized protein n=1 Tax=Phyllosticta citricarpa TaxID=55181 RepID=A0ABR1L5W5_9PEZI
MQRGQSKAAESMTAPRRQSDGDVASKQPPEHHHTSTFISASTRRNTLTNWLTDRTAKTALGCRCRGVVCGNGQAGRQTDRQAGRQRSSIERTIVHGSSVQLRSLSVDVTTPKSEIRNHKSKSQNPRTTRVCPPAYRPPTPTPTPTPTTSTMTTTTTTTTTTKKARFLCVVDGGGSGR